MGFGGFGSCGCHKQISPFGGFSGQCCSSPGFGYPGFRGGSSFALIVVLFILLIIIGASLFGRY